MVMGILIPLMAVLVVGAVVAMVVFVVARARTGAPLELPLRTILVAYFSLMSIVAVLVMTAGLATLLKAGLSVPLGRGFSYMQPAPAMTRVTMEGPRGPSPEDQEEFRQQQIRRVEQEFRNDLVQGGTLALVGAALWPLHAAGRRALARRDDPAHRFFDKAQLTIRLALFSLVGIVALPMGLYELLRFGLLQEEELGYRGPPGGAVATALVYVPFWLYELWQALARMRREDTT